MKKFEDGYRNIMAFGKLAYKAKTVPKHLKKKIPTRMRKIFYKDTVVKGIQEYNNRCAWWLKEHGVEHGRRKKNV